MEPREAWVDLSPQAPHPLARLVREGMRVRLGPAHRSGARYFQVLEGGRLLLAGLFRTGLFPAGNWAEVMGTALDLPPEEEERLGRRLVECLPPGGHLMWEYETRSATARDLERGVPPMLTELGLLLFRAGLEGGFRDWYIPEGWSEGPRKLQAFRPLDEAHRRRALIALSGEVLTFLERPQGRAFLADASARWRARRALGRLAEALVGVPEGEALRRVLERLPDDEGPARESPSLHP